jgi:hypothetical protein
VLRKGNDHGLRDLLEDFLSGGGEGDMNGRRRELASDGMARNDIRRDHAESGKGKEKARDSGTW